MKKVKDVYQIESLCQYTDTRVHNAYQTQSLCQGTDMRKVQGVHQINLSTMLERERTGCSHESLKRFHPTSSFSFLCL